MVESKTVAKLPKNLLRAAGFVLASSSRESSTSKSWVCINPREYPHRAQIWWVLWCTNFLDIPVHNYAGGFTPLQIVVVQAFVIRVKQNDKVIEPSVSEYFLHSRTGIVKHL